jgi:UDP-N-acetyl-D-mannosaminuronate dehydrogenase
MRHIVIGLGEVGGAIMANLKDTGYDVVGYDAGEEEASQEDRKEPHWLHICFPFLAPKPFAASVAEWTRDSGCELVIVHSTTAPGTTRAVTEKAQCITVHSPVNGKHITSRTMETYIRTLPKFFAGPRTVEKSVTRELRNVWDICWLSNDPAVTEFMKILATSYYGLLINWTQYVHRACKLHDLPYAKVMSVFNLIDSEDWRIDNKYPGKWGGHCIIPNFELLRKFAPHDLLEAMHRLNDEHKE